MNPRLVTKFLLGVALAIAGAAQAAPAPKWSLVDLGTLDGYGTRAWAINNRGDVAGNSVDTSFGFARARHAFVWQNGMQDLGASLGTPPGAASSAVYAINDKGMMAGTVDGVATLWRDGAPMSLGISTPMVNDINSSGTVVGTYQTGPIRLGGRFLPFIYKDGILTTLGTLGGDEAHAEAINDRGVVAGWSYTSLGTLRTHAFVYEDGAMRDLGTLGGRDSMALDINNHGTVVGFSEDSTGNFVGFVADKRGGMQALPGGFVPEAINDHGAMIGQLSGSPYLYDGGVLTRLDTLPQLAGYSGVDVTAINDRGWISGYGVKSGSSQPTAFVLMPK